MILQAVISCWLATSTGASRLVTPLTPDPLPISPPTAQQIVEGARLSPGAALVIIGVSLAITAGLLAGAFWWWRAKNEDRRELAFRILARKMRLGAPEQSLVRRLARERSLPPVALLVSVDGLRDLLERSREGGDEATRVWLQRRCG